MTRYGTNYDLAQLAVYADLGEGYEDILGDLTSITIDNGCDHDTWNMAPRASTATLDITLKRGNAYFGNVHLAPVQVQYAGVNLFKGTIRNVMANATPGLGVRQGMNDYRVSLECVSRMFDVSRARLAGLSRPAESGNARLTAVMDELDLVVDTDYAFTTLTAYTCGPTIEPYSGGALEYLNALALSQHARWYCDTSTNLLVMRADTPEVTIAFDPDDAEALDYNTAEYGYAEDEFLSRSVAILTRNEDVTHVSTHASPTHISSQEYLVDVIDATVLEAWNNDMKLMISTPFMPLSLRTADVAEVDWSDVLLGSLAKVKLPYRETVNTVGIIGLRHEIRPERWMSELSFCDRRFLATEDQLAEIEDE
jgi:hypothetical protein